MAAFRNPGFTFEEGSQVLGSLDCLDYATALPFKWGKDNLLRASDIIAPLKTKRVPSVYAFRRFGSISL